MSKDIEHLPELKSFLTARKRKKFFYPVLGKGIRIITVNRTQFIFSVDGEKGMMKQTFNELTQKQIDNILGI